MLIDKELLKRISEVTIGDYEPYSTKNKNEKYIEPDNVICMLEDLLMEIDRLDEQIEDIREFYQEHYVYVPEPEPDISR